MKAFIEEYGTVIFVIVVVAILIAVATFLRNPLGNIFKGKVSNLDSDLNSQASGINIEDTKVAP